ncbi:hypothetical protein [Paenibacillus mendelii]|uniref:Uncharacterized protein n=1 Tax=Paenibacillus mendelii TaxID=206163 RepID=A0ABV6J752_9BACL|nr:hypothetical protein [Paenibacillus mendelii]
MQLCQACCERLAENGCVSSAELATSLPSTYNRNPSGTAGPGLPSLRYSTTMCGPHIVQSETGQADVHRSPVLLDLQSGDMAHHQVDAERMQIIRVVAERLPSLAAVVRRK